MQVYCLFSKWGFIFYTELFIHVDISPLSITSFTNVRLEAIKLLEEQAEHSGINQSNISWKYLLK